MSDAKYPEAVWDLVATYVEDIASRRDRAKVDQWLCVCKKTLTGSFGRKVGHLTGKKGCGLAPCTALSNEERSEPKGLAGGLQKAAPGDAALSLAADAKLPAGLYLTTEQCRQQNRGQQRLEGCLVGASRTKKDLDKVMANFFYTQGIAFHHCR